MRGGSRTGYGSFIKMCPEKKFAVVILGNKTSASLPRVADKAAEVVLNIAPPPLEPRRNLPISAG